MTKRNRTSEPLSAYLDGAMSPADAAAMEKLLAAEPELARELSTLRATRDLVGRLPREHAPDDFARRVVARLERRSLLEPGLHEKPSLSRRRLWVAAAAAAVFLVAGVGTYVALLTFPSPVTVADKSAPHRAVEGPIPLAKVKDAPAPRKDFETGKVSVVTRGSVERETVELAKAPGGPARAKASLRSEIRTETGGPETIYVPVNAGDLTLARRGLERTLFDLEVAPTTEESPASGSATGRAANLVYRTVEASPTQIKYVVANVSRSQLPGVVKRLEEFRQRQDQKQDELASVQTTLALAEAPAEQAAAKEAGNDKTLERAAFLRRVLAEGERAPKPAALAAAKGGGAGGLEIASAEPTGMKKEFSNGDIAQKARDFTAARGGAGAFDAPGKAAKSLAPGDAAVEKNDDASREDAKKDAKGLLNAASPIEAAPSPAAPAAKADAAGNQIAQGKLALAEAPARQGEIMNQAATLDRADYLRRAIVQAKRADKPATAPASAPAKDRAVGGPDIAAIEPPSPTMTNASFAQKANDFQAARAAGAPAAPGRQQIGEGAEGQVASAPPAPKAGEVFPVANTSAVDALPAQGVREHSASRPGEGMGLLQAPAITPAASAQPVQAVDAKHVGAEDRTGVWAVRQARQAGGEALYNVCIILNAPSAAGREARIDPAGARQADDKDDDGNGETPSRE